MQVHGLIILASTLDASSCRSIEIHHNSRLRNPSNLGHVTHTKRVIATSSFKTLKHHRENHRPYHLPGCASHTAKMRTYDDTFSGEKIYPGKVSSSTIYDHIEIVQMAVNHLIGLAGE